MRKYQVHIVVDDFDHEPLTNKDNKIRYSVYADANDFYSALLKGVNEISILYSSINGETFGRCDGYINGKEATNGTH